MFGVFSKFVGPFEKRVSKFFAHIKSGSNPIQIQQNLLKLMEEDLVVLNLFMEKEYKNYAYLKKNVRKQMYDDVKIMNEDFLKFCNTYKIEDNEIDQKLKKLNLELPASHFREQLKLLVKIMQYLKPGKRYAYQASANFGKLLKNPLEQKLIGDCNQIVTLYTYLYSLKYPVKDLKIKILPKHVCLHFEGIDIEATNATFQKYVEYDYVLPITELITTNLLDVVDAEVKTKAIDPHTIVKRAQLAYKVSSMRGLVERNLKIAYRNLGINLLNNKYYDKAIFYFQKLGDKKLISTAYRNGAIHLAKQNDYKKARTYAKYTGDLKLQKSIKSQEAAHYYNKGSYQFALKLYQNLGDQRMIKACYQSLYNALVRKVQHVKTMDDVRKNAATYRQMLKYANLADNKKSATYVRGLLKKI